MYFVRGELNGILSNLGIETNLSLPSGQPITVSTDADSVFYLSYSDLPLTDTQPLSIYWRPQFDNTICKDVNIRWNVPTVDSGLR